ncbi:hypothetical protein L3V86_04620 [Thiotrichales bacterium 19S11-10]|nr:hypothetical protein [Thiotrichales bacterium 19S11-10]
MAKYKYFGSDPLLDLKNKSKCWLSEAKLWRKAASNANDYDYDIVFKPSSPEGDGWESVSLEDLPTAVARKLFPYIIENKERKDAKGAELQKSFFYQSVYRDFYLRAHKEKVQEVLENPIESLDSLYFHKSMRFMCIEKGVNFDDRTNWEKFEGDRDSYFLGNDFLDFLISNKAPFSLVTELYNGLVSKTPQSDGEKRFIENFTIEFENYCKSQAERELKFGNNTCPNFFMAEDGRVIVTAQDSKIAPTGFTKLNVDNGNNIVSEVKRVVKNPEKQSKVLEYIDSKLGDNKAQWKINIRNEYLYYLESEKLKIDQDVTKLHFKQTNDKVEIYIGSETHLHPGFQKVNGNIKDPYLELEEPKRKALFDMLKDKEDYPENSWQKNFVVRYQLANNFNIVKDKLYINNEGKFYIGPGDKAPGGYVKVEGLKPDGSNLVAQIKATLKDNNNVAADNLPGVQQQALNYIYAQTHGKTDDSAPQWQKNFNEQFHKHNEQNAANGLKNTQEKVSIQEFALGLYVNNDGKIYYHMPDAYKKYSEAEKNVATATKAVNSAQTNFDEASDNFNSKSIMSIAAVERKGKAKKAKKNAEKAKKDAEDGVNQRRTDRNKARDEVAKKRKERDEAKAKVEKEEKEGGSENESLISPDVVASAASRSLKYAEDFLNGAQRYLGIAETNLTDAKRALKSAETNLTAAKKELKEAEKDFKKADEEFKEAKKDLKAAEKDLEAAEDSLSSALIHKAPAKIELDHNIQTGKDSAPEGFDPVYSGDNFDEHFQKLPRDARTLYKDLAAKNNGAVTSVYNALKNNKYQEGDWQQEFKALYVANNVLVQDGDAIKAHNLKIYVPKDAKDKSTPVIIGGENPGAKYKEISFSTINDLQTFKLDGQEYQVPLDESGKAQVIYQKLLSENQDALLYLVSALKNLKESEKNDWQKAFLAYHNEYGCHYVAIPSDRMSIKAEDFKSGNITSIREKLEAADDKGDSPSYNSFFGGKRIYGVDAEGKKCKEGEEFSKLVIEASNGVKELEITLKDDRFLVKNAFGKIDEKKAKQMADVMYRLYNDKGKDVAKAPIYFNANTESEYRELFKAFEDRGFDPSNFHFRNPADRTSDAYKKYERAYKQCYAPSGGTIENQEYGKTSTNIKNAVLEALPDKVVNALEKRNIMKMTPKPINPSVPFFNKQYNDNHDKYHEIAATA